MSGSEPPVRVGVLVVRVWFEPDPVDGGGRLVVRLTSRDDVTRDTVERCVTSAVPKAVRCVESWLQRFADGAVTGR